MYFSILSSKSTFFQLSVLHTIDRVPATLPDSQKRSQITFSLGYTRYTPYGINLVSGLPPASIICYTTKDRRSQMIAFQFHVHIASVAFAHSFVRATIHFVVTQNLYPINDTLNHRNSNVCATLTNLITGITTRFILQAILVGRKRKVGWSVGMEFI